MTDCSLSCVKRDQKEAPRFFIIGISGTTNGGKTTATIKLKKLFPHVDTMNQDTYFLEPDDERLELIPKLNGFGNWEDMRTIDMNRMLQDVDRWKAEAVSSHHRGAVPILIIEGFLIFNHDILTKSFHKKYFLQIDRNTCIDRRRSRTYNPPDGPGYFEKVVWPMYLKNREELSSQHDIVFLDGTKNQEDLVRQIAEDIRHLVGSV